MNDDNHTLIVYLKKKLKALLDNKIHNDLVDIFDGSNFFDQNFTILHCRYMLFKECLFPFVLVNV